MKAGDYTGDINFKNIAVLSKMASHGPDCQGRQLPMQLGVIHALTDTDKPRISPYEKEKKSHGLSTYAKRPNSPLRNKNKFLLKKSYITLDDNKKH